MLPQRLVSPTLPLKRHPPRLQPHRLPLPPPAIIPPPPSPHLPLLLLKFLFQILCQPFQVQIQMKIRLKWSTPPAHPPLALLPSPPHLRLRPPHNPRGHNQQVCVSPLTNGNNFPQANHPPLCFPLQKFQFQFQFQFSPLFLVPVVSPGQQQADSACDMSSVFIFCDPVS